MNLDNRQGFPSASGMPRIYACPGSFLAEQAATGEDHTDKSDAEKGTRVHDALCGALDPETLSADEFRTFELCREQADQIVRDFLGDEAPTALITDNVRLWITEALELVCSAKPDRVVVAGSRAVVIEFKALLGNHEQAAGNVQLRTQAVAVVESFDVDEVLVAKVQPLAGKPSLAVYLSGDLKQAREEVIERCKLAITPGQPRTPSAEACRYCRARGTNACPESLAEVEALAVALPRSGASIALTGQQIAAILDKAPAVEAVIEAVRAKARRELEADPGAIPGWGLEEGDEREKVTNPELVFGRFSALGGTSQQFMAAVSVTKKGLGEAVRSATGQRGKALDLCVKSLLEGATETKRNQPSLVRVKGGAS